MSNRNMRDYSRTHKTIPEESFFPEYDNPGELRMISTSKLNSGLPYQRPVVKAEVDRLVREWDSRLLEPLSVSFRDSKFNLMDGQRRMTALRIMNGGRDVMVLCRVYTGLTYEQEAELCYKLDQAKKRMTMAQSVNALVESGSDAETADILMLMEQEGFVWALGKSRGKEYEIVVTRSVYDAYCLLGREAFARMLRLLGNTWHGDPASLGAVILSGMALFLKSYETELNDQAFARCLSAVDPAEILRISKTDFSTNSVALRCARVLLVKYNKSRRGHYKLQYRFNG